VVMGDVGKYGYLFSNIAYNLSGVGFGMEGEDSYTTHNTSYNNNWNYYGASSVGAATVLSNISQSGATYEFRSSYSSISDFNIAADTTAPGLNSLENTTLGEVHFLNTTPGSENLCTSVASIAYISGPKMIEESDPFKIYYDTAGNLRKPSDSYFPIGACAQIQGKF